jgi:hypothetical protein
MVCVKSKVCRVHGCCWAYCGLCKVYGLGYRVCGLRCRTRSVYVIGYRVKGVGFVQFRV